MFFCLVIALLAELIVRCSWQNGAELPRGGEMLELVELYHVLMTRHFFFNEEVLRVELYLFSQALHEPFTIPEYL